MTHTLRHLRPLLAVLLLVGFVAPVLAGDFAMPGERGQQRRVIGPNPGSAGNFVLSNGTKWTQGDPSLLAAQQLARNGSMAIAQRAMPTADNTYSLDGWRLEIENANGVVITQDTADVPVGAGYAAKLVVGSGNNGKFGLFSPIENKDMLKVRGRPVSLLVPLKATAGLTDGAGKIRICIAQWTGTADAVSADPVTTWGAEGTNPTLSGSWSCANTPVAIPVTTSWADYKVENVSISLSATNIGIFIWSDDRATTTTTDILRIGGYVTLTQGAIASSAIVLSSTEERSRCFRYYELGGNGTAGAWYATTAAYTAFVFKVTKRATPSLSLNTTSPIMLDPGTANITGSGSALAVTGASVTAIWGTVNGFSGATSQRVAILEGDYLVADSDL